MMRGCFMWMEQNPHGNTLDLVFTKAALKKSMKRSNWGVNPQVPLTQGHKRRHLLNPIEGKLVECHAKVVEDLANEAVCGHGESPHVVGEEAHHVSLRMVGALLTVGNKPLHIRGPRTEKAMCGERVKLRVTDCRPLPLNHGVRRYGEESQEQRGDGNRGSGETRTVVQQHKMERAARRR